MIRNEVFRDGVVIAADIYDLATNTYSREEAGTIVATRPMTADEIAAYTPAPPVPTAEERIAAIAEALAPLENLTAPVLAIEVVEILEAVRVAATGGT